eukprot:1326792-Amorphochlora_amoeboformis.AAC.1
MRSDEDVKMISAEAPVLFAKACELFILDLTMRAWSHADANRRRTLQREDVAAAISDSDMFDFLLDVVPRQTVDQNKESIDSSAVAQLASKNAQVGSEELEPVNNQTRYATYTRFADIWFLQSDHRLRRPILNPLTPNQTPIDMIMPVPVDSKSQDQTSLEHLPDTSQRRDWPISGQNSFNRMLLGPATTEASLATGSASLSANLQSSGAPSTANQPPGGAPI